MRLALRGGAARVRRGGGSWRVRMESLESAGARRDCDGRPGTSRRRQPLRADEASREPSAAPHTYPGAGQGAGSGQLSRSAAALWPTPAPAAGKGCPRPRRRPSVCQESPALTRRAQEPTGSAHWTHRPTAAPTPSTRHRSDGQAPGHKDRGRLALRAAQSHAGRLLRRVISPSTIHQRPSRSQVTKTTGRPKETAPRQRSSGSQGVGAAPEQPAT